MRLFVLAALAVAPILVHAQSVTSRFAVDSAADMALPPSPEAEPRNAVSFVLGGEGLSAGVGYERRLGSRWFVRTGAQYYGNGVDIQAGFVPVVGGARFPLSRRWSADASAGVTLALRSINEETIPELGIEAQTDVDLIPVPALGAGIRYEAGALSLRGGLAVFPARFDYAADRPARWSALPWPSLSAGVRF